MAKMLRDGQAWLREQRAKHYSDAVSYQAQAAAAVAIKATRAQFDSAAIDDGNRVDGRMVDWLVDVAELGAVVPLAGDRIVVDGKSYEVCTAVGSSAWVYHDRAELTYRIHTVAVKTMVIP